jgi:hypothetical protein
MDNRKRVESQVVVEEEKDSDSDRHTSSTKLVEMGQVSVETKGIARGLELGFTPKN